ncbi:MAG: dienelactone hydrolase family protein, partial [Candidatus Acidiferrales bacterium]
MTRASPKLNSATTATADQAYDPFARGPFPVGVRSIQIRDKARDRLFPCEIWYPAASHRLGQDLSPATQDTFTVPSSDTPRRQAAVRDAAPEPGTYPLILFSHHSAGHRRAATFLTTHLASHGYLVAALDHSEVIAPELARKAGETPGQTAARMQAVIAGRVPDIRFLLDYLLALPSSLPEAAIDPSRVGIVGHSFGGWTALATPEADRRVRAIVALAPGGASNPRPGILPVTLTFAWNRDVPTLYLVAENDVSLPLAGMYEIFERTPATKRMFILHRADHLHFIDNVEHEHEKVRAMQWPPALAWIQKEMKPVAELCSGEQAHLFIRGLTLCHTDAFLKHNDSARRFLAGNIEAELASRSLSATAY